jgi:hypothetical protein
MLTHKRAVAVAAVAALQVEAPAFFPPSFLYTQSWEDPRADEPYLQVGPAVRPDKLSAEQQGLGVCGH